MGDIFDKVGDQVPKGLFGLQVLLAAGLAISSQDDTTAVQTIFFGAFR
jgi:hypothetical protein